MKRKNPNKNPWTPTTNASILQLENIFKVNFHIWRFLRKVLLKTIAAEKTLKIDFHGLERNLEGFSGPLLEGIRDPRRKSIVEGAKIKNLSFLSFGPHSPQTAKKPKKHQKSIKSEKTVLVSEEDFHVCKNVQNFFQRRFQGFIFWP